MQICVSKDNPCLASWWIGRNVNVWRIIWLEFLFKRQTRQMFQIDSFFYCVWPLHHFPVLYFKKRWFSLRTLIVNGSRPSTQGSPLLWLWSSFRNQPFFRQLSCKDDLSRWPLKCESRLQRERGAEQGETDSSTVGTFLCGTFRKRFWGVTTREKVKHTGEISARWLIMFLFYWPLKAKLD